jgi:transposase
MTDEDARSLPGAAQAALRNRAVRAVLDGVTHAQAAQVFGVHPNAVNRWIRRYRQGGWAGLSARRGWRRAGEQAALTEPQQQEVIALVRDPSAPMSRSSPPALIERLGKHAHVLYES